MLLICAVFWLHPSKEWSPVAILWLVGRFPRDCPRLHTAGEWQMPHTAGAARTHTATLTQPTTSISGPSSSTVYHAALLPACCLDCAAAAPSGPSSSWRSFCWATSTAAWQGASRAWVADHTRWFTCDWILHAHSEMCDCVRSSHLPVSFSACGVLR